MAITLIKRLHTCESCGMKDKELFAIKLNSDIVSEFHSEDIPETIKSDGVYVECVIRDEFGIITSRVVREKACPNCNTFTLVLDKRDNEENVLNFFPRTDAHKWLDGLGKAGL